MYSRVPNNHISTLIYFRKKSGWYSLFKGGTLIDFWKTFRVELLLGTRKMYLLDSDRGGGGERKKDRKGKKWIRSRSMSSNSRIL